MKKLLGALCLICLLFSAAFCIESRATGTLTGAVYDAATQQPLPGANVTIVGTVMGAASDAKGEFRIRNVPAGKYAIAVTMIGYRRRTVKDVVISSNQTTTVRVELQETVLETPELVVTAAKRRQQIQESPNSIDVLTERFLAQTNEIYLDGALQYASGLHFIGSQVNIRGSSGFNYGAGSRVLFLIDGVPVMPGDSGDIKWDTVPTTQIERVEVVKGAGSALYGSSALGGVINVVSKSGGGLPRTNLRLSSGIYDRPAYPEWRWTTKPLWFSDVDVDHSRRIGNSELFIAAGRHQSTGYIQNTQYLRHNGSVKWTYRADGTHLVTLFVNYEGGESHSSLMWRSQRRALEVNPEAVGDWVESQKIGTNLMHQWVVRKNLRLQSRFSYFNNYWKNWYHDNITASTAQKPGFELQGDWQFSEHNSLLIGSEGSWDHVESGLVGQHDQYTLAGYVQNERRLFRRLNLTLGLRYDNQYVDIGFRDDEWNPKVGLVWQISPQWTARASAGRGFRAASMSERFPSGVYSGLTIVPSPDLRSETAWSHETGVVWKPSEAVYCDASLFISDYWNLIEPRPNEQQVIRFINVTRARIGGFEMMWKLQPTRALSLDLGLTFMDPRDLSQGTVLAYRPRRLATLGASYTFSSFELGVNARYASRLDRVEVYPNDERVAQKVVDLRVGYRYRGLRLSLQVNNLFNYNYTQMERTLMPIRHFVLTAIVQQ